MILLYVAVKLTEFNDQISIGKINTAEKREKVFTLREKFRVIISTKPQLA
jgi:hypothetical protein